ncbi:MAG: hypothetical protein P8P26_01015 [Porticoccaceae bacterium]|jgi:hypothetical protein|nr:hypothetical protein [Porticoccaceae bacterium]MDG1310624.1 hypothetical protein [Porticoccaceae bacterium]
MLKSTKIITLDRIKPQYSLLAIFGALLISIFADADPLDIPKPLLKQVHFEYGVEAETRLRQ